MATNIRQAQHFWMQAGELSGGARNQIEFTDNLARFFSDAERITEIVRIRFSGSSAIARPLTYRGNDYGQWTEDIWRLGLPTANMGAPDYQGRVVKLERIATPSGNEYELLVEDVGSGLAQQWRMSAQTHGIVSSTGDTGVHQGRDFGYW